MKLSSHWSPLGGLIGEADLNKMEIRVLQTLAIVAKKTRLNKVCVSRETHPTRVFYSETEELKMRF